MARRPADGDSLSETELAELRRNLSLLSGPSVVDFYRDAYKECAVERQAWCEGRRTAIAVAFGLIPEPLGSVERAVLSVDTVAGLHIGCDVPIRRLIADFVSSEPWVRTGFQYTSDRGTRTPYPPGKLCDRNLHRSACHFL